MANKCLLTGASAEYSDLLAVTAPNKLQYCLRHGYKLTIARFVDMSKVYVTVGERILVLLQELKRNDYVFFMGADTLIMNMEISLDSYCGEHDLVISRDLNGINNDVMVVKNTGKSQAYFEKLLSLKRYNDQEAMKMHIGSLFVNYVPQRKLNSYISSLYGRAYSESSDYQDGDFVLHVPGLPLQTKISVLTEYERRRNRHDYR